jgi:phospholipase C
VIVIIGENHTFDNIFATYQPPAGQAIWNLRSEGIVTANGTRARTSARPPSSPPATPRPTP